MSFSEFHKSSKDHSKVSKSEFRQLLCESLEDRRLLASDLGQGTHNPLLEEFLQQQHAPEVRPLAPLGSQVEVADHLDYTEQIIASELISLGAEPDDFEIAYDFESDQSGVNNVYVQQTYEGLEVLNAVANVSTINDNFLVSGFSAFVTPQVDPTTLTLEAAEALQSLSNKFDWFDGEVDIQSGGTDGDQEILLASQIAEEPVTAELAYVPVENGTIELSWRLNVQRLSNAEWLDAAVSASSGEVLSVANWVANASYEAFAFPKESPSDGNRTIEVDPHDVQASPFGWHDTNGSPGADVFDTTGNNVNAYTDTDANNQPDPGSSPTAGPTLDFRAPFDATQAPASYRDAAVINLYYWNNVIHDVLANHGFTEASGNFQRVNYSGDGLGNDPVLAEAQDGSGLNNANFATPPDGFSGRMQMFIFNIANPNRGSSFDNGVIAHEYGHGLSNRLTGGAGNSGALRNVQSRGMGEGWSDFLSLIFTQKPGDQATDGRGIGTYVLNQPPTGAGIRTERYSYDMGINTKTLGSIAGLGVVHTIGETWASTLWDLTWALIDGRNLDPNFGHDGLGFNPDLHNGQGGNNMALRLVVEAMKLQPANPSFIQARDGILQADRILNCGLFQDTIWRVFARRGMGRSADAGTSGATVVNEAFDVPISLDLDTRIPIFQENGPAVAVNPGLTIKNTEGLNINGLAVDISIRDPDSGDEILILDTGTGPGEVSTSGNQVLFEGQAVGSFNQAPDGSISIRFTTDDEAIATEVLRAVGFQNATNGPSTRIRHIEFSTGGLVHQCAKVDVIGMNDEPILSPQVFGPILEDAVDFTPFEIADSYGASFVDSDPQSSLAALAVVGSIEDPAQGSWYYSSNGFNWEPLGNIVDVSQSVLIGGDGFLSFLPAPDYFGIPNPIDVRALDNTYLGPVSNTVTGERIPFEPTLIEIGGPVSNLSELSVEVVNVNDPPIANFSQLSFTVDQGKPFSTQLPDNLFTDPDSPNLELSLTAEAGNVFPDWLLFENGILSGTPQNEDVGLTQFNLTGSDGLASSNIPVFLSVINVNDPPAGLRANGNTLAENNITDPIAALFAFDVDAGDEITWTVSDPRFEVRDEELFATTPIDFETEQFVSLVLTATDDGSPRLSATLDLEVEVLDENEHLPTLDGGEITVEDGTVAGTEVADFDATDADTFQTVTYQLVEDGDFDVFSVDSQTGILTLNEEAKFANQATYRVFVEAVDSGTPTKSRVTQFKVNVEPVNAFAPTANSPQTFEVSENLGDGAVVGQFVADDQDGDNLTYDLLSGTNEFAIDPQTGEITLQPGVQLDFETQSTYAFVVRTTEQTEPNRSVNANVTVTVTDENDAPTGLTLDGDGRVRISRQGLSVGLLGVTDPDAIPSTYSFAPADSRFEVVNGVLKLTDESHLTPNDLGQMEVAIQVTDTADTSIFATLPVTIEVFEAAAWTNIDLPADVTRDGNVVPLDALLVINELNQTGGGMLSDPRTVAEQERPDFDTNGDGFLSSVDALIVVNAVNAGSGEGESDLAPVSIDIAKQQQDTIADAWLSAYFEIEKELEKRR